jgi:plasmid stabilization system protein ParE
MSHTVVFTPEAEAQLVELYVHIAAKASPEIAARFTNGIVGYCESLSTFPPVETGATTFAPASALPAIESALASHST